MKFFKIITLGFFIFTFCSASTVFCDSSSSLYVPLPVHNFKPVLEGTKITHTFRIENRGTMPININKVKTGCGCATARYTKTIAPASVGEVVITGNTSGYGGRLFSKSIKVFTSDPANKQLALYLKGDVEHFASVSPGHVFLMKANQSSTVTITPLEKYPFNITDIKPGTLAGKIRYSLEKKNGAYQLSVKNIHKEKGRFHGRLRVMTDHPEKKEITISVRGKVY